MVEKWYCIICDNCKEVMNYWQVSSAKDALRREKSFNDPDTKIYSNGKTFCSIECEKEYLKNRRNVVKN